MPKATVNKKGDAVSRQDNIGLAWQITPMQPVRESKLAKRTSDSALGIRVP
jgi:hypothetical protein